MTKKYSKPIRLRGHHLRILRYYADVYSIDPDEERLRKLHDSAIYNSRSGGHSRNHGVNIVETMKKAFKQGTKIQLTDTLDDICVTCNYKTREECKEFIPYGVSATSDDRGVLHFYNLQKRVYTSDFIVKRLLKKGRDL